MVSFGSLWLPILVSAIFVYIASTIIHMALKYHASDYRQLPNEDAIRAAMRTGNPQPGQYMFPYCKGMKEMKTPEMQAKFAEGPIGTVTIRGPGALSMGVPMISYFIFNVVISILVAGIACHALSGTVGHRRIFHVVGLVSWLAYAGGHVPSSIWLGKPWSVTIKEIFDGLIYGIVMGLTFVWLWPHG